MTVLTIYRYISIIITDDIDNNPVLTIYRYIDNRY